MRTIAAIAVVAALASPATAQQPPYAGMDGRGIKALSEQQIADLKAGRGMGLALAAELNGYPGPIHVLELGAQLNLTEAQRAKMQALYEAMKAEAIPLGEKLIAEELALERSFAARTITDESLAATTRAIGAIKADLRAAHLRYHLSTAAALSEHQIKLYGALRGYAGAAMPQHRHRRH